MYYLRTLGGLRLLRGGVRGTEVGPLANSKTLLILAWLARQEDHSESREFLAQFFWPGGDRWRARRALRQALFFLTQHAEGALERDKGRIRLNTDRVRVDLWEFDRAIDRHDYQTALALCRGPFAAGVERKVGVEAEHWIEAQHARVSGALAVVYPEEVTRLLREGDPEEAVRLARTWVERNPMIDRAQHLLIRTLAAAGCTIDAIEAFEEYRVRLASESESVPPELHQTMDLIRAQAAVAPDADGGITVEMSGRIAITAKGRPVFSATLFDQDGSASALAAESPPGVSFRVVGPTSTDPAHVTVLMGTKQVAVPVPFRPGQRQRYTLRIQPDGVLELLVDGRTYWRSAERAQPPRSARLPVALGSGTREAARPR